MKIVLSILFSSILFISNGQTLKNTEWVRLLEKDKTGVNINISQILGRESIKYFFTGDSAFISTNDEYFKRVKYSSVDSVLSIGDFLSFKIDSLSDQILILTEIPKEESKFGQTVTYVLLNTDYLFDYLKQSNQIVFLSDSTVLGAKLFSPTYNGNLSEKFSLALGSVTTDRNYAGSFIISGDGNIKDIEIRSDKKLSTSEKDIITGVIKSTEKSWIIPPTPSPLNFKVTFNIILKLIYNSKFGVGGMQYSFHLNTKDD